MIHAHARGRRDAFHPDDVRTVLREYGLTNSQAAPFTDFYISALDLLAYYEEQAG